MALVHTASIALSILRLPQSAVLKVTKPCQWFHRHLVVSIGLDPLDSLHQLTVEQCRGVCQQLQAKAKSYINTEMQDRWFRSYLLTISSLQKQVEFDSRRVRAWSTGVRLLPPLNSLSFRVSLPIWVIYLLRFTFVHIFNRVWKRVLIFAQCHYIDVEAHCTLFKSSCETLLDCL